MKRLYSIQIYRSTRFRVLHFLLLLFFVWLVAVDLYDVIHIGFSEYFFPNRGQVSTVITIALLILYILAFIISCGVLLVKNQREHKE